MGDRVKAIHLNADESREFIRNLYLSTEKKREINGINIVETITGFIAEVDGLDLSFANDDD